MRAQRPHAFNSSVGCAVARCGKTAHFLERRDGAERLSHCAPQTSPLGGHELTLRSGGCSLAGPKSLQARSFVAHAA